MEPGIMLYIDCKVDIYEQIRTLKEIGIKRTFVNARHPQIDKVIEAIKNAGIICDNLHSEFEITHNGQKYGTQDMCCPGEGGDIMMKRIMSNIDTCAKHDIPVIVVHAPHESPGISINEFSRKRYSELGNYAKEKGVKIAIENTSYSECVGYAMSLIPDAKFCWDCGHENCKPINEKPMPMFGKKLAALHIHDNCLKNDDHCIPFTMSIDFNNVAKKLAASGYDGTLMLEIAYGSGAGNSTEKTYKEYALKAKSAAEKIIAKVKQYREK